MGKLEKSLGLGPRVLGVRVPPGAPNITVINIIQEAIMQKVITMDYQYNSEGKGHIRLDFCPLEQVDSSYKEIPWLPGNYGSPSYFEFKNQQ